MIPKLQVLCYHPQLWIYFIYILPGIILLFMYYQPEHGYKESQSSKLLLKTRQVVT